MNLIYLVVAQVCVAKTINLEGKGGRSRKIVNVESL